MAESFSILGRGRAGRALAEAWTGVAALLPHDAEPAGLVLLAVPDDAIAALAAKFQGRCAHLSGSLHIEGVPSLHPLTSFDGRAADWRGTPLAVTGEAPARLVQAFRGLGFEPFDLPADLKPLYHACAVLSSSHAAALWLGAAGMLAERGVAVPGRGFLPLAEATLRNIESHGERGRTGPFVRGDAGTIARDAAALPGEWREVFLRLGRL
ncbi:MAG TPA: DUF2520 domain-containing protein [Holophagaceae bacterium]|jgi:predicted short-subunit dehydrogenase-like oxidoreductase (DUF2520 family)|nr:DUF2520 domain-containing protein [Holophagaceae bacterium]